ncbi:MAG: TonB-dependent receptor, partial [Sphingomonadales bacterium]
MTSVVAIAAAGVLSLEASAQGFGQIEEIMVTAERREQSLQSVPISVTALSAQRLGAAGVESTLELTFMTPSLNMTRLRQSSSPFIRGVGTLTATAGFEVPVSTYIDGVYMPSMPGGIFSLNSIERVEVLKGPQGTLFGRNALGGVVQVVTRDPSQEPEVKVSVTYGNYDTYGGDFYGTTGITDNLAADLAVRYRNQGDGYGINEVTGNEVNWAEELNIRTKFLLELDRTRLTLSFDYSKLDASQIAGRFYPGSVAATGVLPVEGFQDVALSVDPNNETEQFGGYLKIDHDLGFANLISTTAFRRVDSSFNLPNWLPFNLADIFIDEFNNSMSQEFQLQSNTDGPLQWTAGVYLFRLKGGFDPLMVTGAAVAAIGSESRFPIIRTRSAAAYGQATYAITDDTRVTAGLRYTIDEQRVEAIYTRPNVGVALEVPRNKETWEKPTWRLAIDHDLTDDIMVYASYNRGFKSGTFTASSPADVPVDPETIDSFEIGKKAEFWDRRLRLNTAVYYFTHKNIQLTSLGGSPPLARLLNAAKGRTYGLEMEAELVPVENLSLRAAFALTDAKYKDFPDGPLFTPNPGGGNATGFADLSGSSIVYTP